LILQELSAMVMGLAATGRKSMGLIGKKWFSNLLL